MEPLEPPSRPTIDVYTYVLYNYVRGIGKGTYIEA